MNKFYIMNIFRALLCAFTIGFTITATWAIPNESNPISLLKIQQPISSNFYRCIGIDKNNFLICVLSTIPIHSKGEVTQLDFHSHKVFSHFPLSALVDPNSLILSPDGAILVAHENPFDISINPPRAHKATVVSTESNRILTTFDIGSTYKITNMNFINGNSNLILLQLLSAIPFGKSDFIYGHDRFVILNLKTGKTEKIISYSHARGVSKPIFSSDQKYLACLFRGQDQEDKLGILDVLDPDSGKILWHLEGSDTQPIGDPFFFISPTKFVSSSAIYDITTKTHSPLIPANDPRLYCVANVAHQTDYAFFMTKVGLELWNIKTNQALRRWPALTGQGFILMSPDLKTFSYQQGENIQFWRFDPAWLK